MLESAKVMTIPRVRTIKHISKSKGKSIIQKAVELVLAFAAMMAWVYMMMEITLWFLQ